MGHYGSEMEPATEGVGPPSRWPIANSVALIDLVVQRGDKNEHGQHETTLEVGGRTVVRRYYPPTYTPQDAARSLLREWLR